MTRKGITRRELLRGSAALGCIAGVPLSIAASGIAGGTARQQSGAPGSSSTSPTVPSPLKPPKTGRIPVAYPLSAGVVDIDFTGPWAVFGSVMLPGGDMTSPFQQYSIAATKAPLVTGSGMTVVPDYTFETAPQPKVIVIPAEESSEAMLKWIRKASVGADLTMSICVGAIVLAKTGLLDGKRATTHHGAYKFFAETYPKVKLIRGVRYVEEGNIATAGGLSCGIDLAMRVVERYYGQHLAEDTVDNLEYQGPGWKDASSNAIYAQLPAGPSCPVCGMPSDAAKKVTATYKGKIYYFCRMGEACKAAFDADPNKFAEAS
jgi:putative intracellular protease/amidase/YHS domain-containing protein